MTAPKIKIPKGWRRLRSGERIKATDRYWAWNEGPWLEHGTDGSNGQDYVPFREKSTMGCHWVNIRKIRSKPRKQGKK